MKRGERRIQRIPKHCSLINEPIFILQEQQYSPFGLGSSGGEWVDGRRLCSNYEDCNEKNLDCKWALGTAHSRNDPMS